VGIFGGPHLKEPPFDGGTLTPLGDTLWPANVRDWPQSINKNIFPASLGRRYRAASAGEIAEQMDGWVDGWMEDLCWHVLRPPGCSS